MTAQPLPTARVRGHFFDQLGQAGIDRALVELLAAACPLPVTYAGGACSLADQELINRLGRGRIDATIGSALDIFGGPLSYAAVVAWNRRARRP